MFKSVFCEVILCSLPEIASLVSDAHLPSMCLQRINKHVNKNFPVIFFIFISSFKAVEIWQKVTDLQPSILVSNSSMYIVLYFCSYVFYSFFFYLYISYLAKEVD